MRHRLPATSGECAEALPLISRPNFRFGWRAIAALGAATLALLIVIIFSRRILPPSFPEVQVVRASTREAENSGQILERGYIVAHHRINVNSKVTGRVAWIGVEKGDRVKQGDILVRLEDDEFRAQVQQAEGAVSNAAAYLQQLRSGPRPQEIHQAEHSLQQARAGMLATQLTLQRTTELVGQGVLAKQALDDAQARFESSRQQVEYLEQSLQLVRMGSRPEEIARAEGSLEQAKGQLALAQSQLEATVIRAPISGTILERTAEKGELVTAQFAGGSEDGPQG
ncbi:MAG: HlyD family secretion protein, partial [Terriglobales bacterium]